MPTINGLTVRIEVDGAPLEEYQVKSTADAVTCYVESQADKDFAVNLDLAPGITGCYSLKLALDGIKITGKAIEADRKSHFKIKHVRTGSTTCRKLKFAHISLVEDDVDANNSEKLIKGLGSIRVEMWKTGPTTKPVPREPKRQILDVSTQKFDEKCKKAQLAHTTGFGKEKKARPRTVVYSQKIGNKPAAIFEFYYRSRALLEANDLIPATSTLPVASTSAIEQGEQVIVNDPDPVEASSNSRVKQEETVSTTRVKREAASQAGPSTEKKPKLEKRAVVDLTLSDDE